MAVLDRAAHGKADHTPGLQAGSDSLLTAFTFLRLKETCFNGALEAVAKHKGILYGLGADGHNELIAGAAD